MLASDQDIHSMPGHLVRRLHQICQSIFSTATTKAGFNTTSVQYAALSALLRYGEMDQRTLAAAIAYDRVTIGSVVDRLNSHGYVTRRKCHRDKRARIVSIANKGRTLLDNLSEIVADAQGDMLFGLTKKERAELIRLLIKATNAANETSRAPYRKPERK